MHICTLFPIIPDHEFGGAMKIGIFPIRGAGVQGWEYPKINIKLSFINIAHLDYFTDNFNKGRHLKYFNFLLIKLHDKFKMSV